jgi:hypothetical protein
VRRSPYAEAPEPEPFRPLPKLPPASVEVEQWMHRHLRRIIVARVRERIERSQRRHAKRALVDLADLAFLIRDEPTP